MCENLLLPLPAHYRGQPMGVVRFWAHECMRIWKDRLLFEEDETLFMSFVGNAIKQFSDTKAEDVLAEPLIYTSFVSACEGHEATCLPIKGMEHLKGVLEAKLEEYNE